jgi:hypothetical protein
VQAGGLGPAEAVLVPFLLAAGPGVLAIVFLVPFLFAFYQTSLEQPA